MFCFMAVGNLQWAFVFLAKNKCYIKWVGAAIFALEYYTYYCVITVLEVSSSNMQAYWQPKPDKDELLSGIFKKLPQSF